MVQEVHGVGRTEPSKAVVPLFRLDLQGRPQEFLGSAFFAGEDCLLVSAKHVADAGAGRLGIAVLPDVANVYRAALWKSHDHLDISILHVDGYRPPMWFKLGDENALFQNQPVLCCEYGDTLRVGNEIQISIATRLGNITRNYPDAKHFPAAGENALELSFPALRGASGSPVLSQEGQLVWGVVIGNNSREFSVDQVERMVGDPLPKDPPTRFIFPQAIAVNVRHLRGLLSPDA